jgi:hypothetical protein
VFLQEHCASRLLQAHDTACGVGIPSTFKIPAFENVGLLQR